MAKQQFYKPSRRPERDDGMHHENDDFVLPTSQPVSPASENAAQALDEIDQVLADSDAISQAHRRSLEADDIGANEEDAESPETTSAQEQESEALAARSQEGYANEIPFNDEGGKRKRKGRFSRRQKIGVGLTGLVMTAGAFGVLTIVGGPGAQLFKLAQILGKFSHTNESAISHRTGNLLGSLRAARTGNIGETRVSVLGSRRFNAVEAQLRDIGITLDAETATGRLSGVNIDPSKNPAFNKGSPTAQRAAIAEHYQIGVNEVIRNGEGWKIDTANLKGKYARLFRGSSVELLGNGKTINALNRRAFGKFFGIQSAFHPLTNEVTRKTADYHTRQAILQRENLRQGKRTAVLNDRYTQAKARINGAIGPYKTAITGALFFTGSLCLVRGVADAIPLVNYASVVVPSMVQATDKEAIGAQYTSSQDFNLGHLRDIQESLVAEDGKTIWESKALNALATGGPGQGEEISDDYKQAFTTDTTATNIRNFLDANGATDLACSEVGLFVQFLGSVALTALGPGGWVAKTASFGAETVAFYFAIEFLTDRALDEFTVDPVAIFSGPLGGFLLAHGGRAVNNLNAVSMGGIALSDTESRILFQEAEIKSREEFQQKSFFARMFDISDYRSVASAVTLSSSFNTTQDLSRVASALLRNPAQAFTNSLSILTPKTSAAVEPYDWGFPLYSIPRDILNNPTYEDPYENAETAAGLFSNGTGYQDKAKTCFGVDIARGPEGWDATQVQEVNPTEDAYVNANCGDRSDPGWIRTMLFVFDSSIVNNVDCYLGGTQSCQKSGFGNTVAAPAANIGNLSCPADLSTSLTSPDGSKTIYQIKQPAGNEYIVRPGEAQAAAQQYGIRELLCVLDTAGKAYNQVMGGESKLEVWDLAAGSPHVSHLFTVGVDLRGSGNKVAADRENDGGKYDTQATIELGKAFVNTGLVRNIWWCEPGAEDGDISGDDGSMNAIRDYATSIGKPITIKCISSHHHHFHIDINGPRNPIYCPPGDTFGDDYTVVKHGFSARKGEACDGWR